MFVPGFLTFPAVSGKLLAMRKNIDELTIFPEEEMTFRVPAKARIVGITHDRPYPHICLESDLGVGMEERTFRSIRPSDKENFDTTGWGIVATTIIGGEEPGEAWETIHVWEYHG